jgi:hypothetical protein
MLRCLDEVVSLHRLAEERSERSGGTSAVPVPSPA